MSSKGGVGKTLIASALSLASAEKGYRVGLLDLDITNPSAHIVFSVEPGSIEPIEEKGVEPPVVAGVKFMTIAYYSGENPLPLRGQEIDNAIREILAITRWGELDLLFIDTPPGLSDEVLDVLSYFREPKPLIVATPSPLAIRAVERLIALLRDSGVHVLGVIENMAVASESRIAKLCREKGVNYLGTIPFDPNVDAVLGSIEGLKRTSFYRSCARLLEKIVEKLMI